MTQVILDYADDVALLTLDRQTSLNAISGRTIDDLNQALDSIEGDGSLALVITGAGRAFCAGADLREEGVDRVQRVQAMHSLALRLVNYPKISVAALNGLAFGGGLELAMACTFRVAADGITLALPEAKVLKALPGFGGTQLLPRLVGRAQALEMLLTGDAISAERALAIGLVNTIADDCVASALKLAKRASVSGPQTIRLIRDVVNDGLATDFAGGLKLEAAAAQQASASEAALAALAAFSQNGSASVKTSNLD